ncbi:MAG: conjugal transfer protein TraX [Oscillospiraceae bacterium]|nr:conjugal transfer protein TraX [Oscillospiraceae bacterium]
MKKTNFEVTSFGLHILAMTLMLCDHLWITVVPGNNWLTDIGRIAFPIFAFMTVEGFFYTKNLKKYVKRLILFALISEIPFNLVIANSVFYPLHQNVLWTFLIGFGLIWINEKAKDRKTFARILVAAITVVMGYILGIISFCDYYSAGVLTVLVFYFFRGRKWWNFVFQALCLWYINTEILSGFYYEWNIFGMEIEVLRQSFAMFALVPIWLYKGKQGFYNKGIKALYYWFYPAHLFVLWMIREIIA